MPVKADPTGPAVAYRRRWFELRGDVRGQTLVIAEFEGEDAYERAAIGAQKVANGGYENVHVVNCHLVKVYRRVDLEWIK